MRRSEMVAEYAVWTMRLAVAAVFLLAAFGKLTDRVATRQALREFGVALRSAPVVAVALPALEIAIAVGVVAPASAVAACLAALLLLAVFTAAIGYQLRSGRHPDCACFGATSAPVSAATVVRNAAIGVLAVAALAGSLVYAGLPSGLPADHAIAIAAFVALAAVQVRQGAALRALRRQLADRGAASAAREGLAVGAAAPEFDLPDLDGRRASLRGLLTGGRPLALVFVHPTCAPCRTLVEDLRGWRDSRALTVMAVGSGGMDANAAWAREQRLPELLVQHDHEVGARYGVRGTPAAVLVDAGGRIASPVAAGPGAVRELIAEHARLPPPSDHRAPTTRSRHVQSEHR